MKTERDKLLVELYNKFGMGAFMYQDDVADFILADRKRITLKAIKVATDQIDLCGSSMSRQSTCKDIAINLGLELTKEYL